MNASPLWLRIASALTLSIGATVAAITPAYAAAATTTIVVDADVILSGESVDVSGTCATGTDAVVSISGDTSGELVSSSFPVTDGAYSGSITATTDEPFELATVMVTCLGYGDSEVSTASTETALVNEQVATAEIAVSPNPVMLGGTLAVTGFCPVGDTALLILGASDAERPFAAAEVPVADDGTVSASVPVVRGNEDLLPTIAPTTGPAIASIVCYDGPLGDFTELNDLNATSWAFGYAEFDISPAAVVPVKAPANPRPVHTAGAPTLANTGAQNTAPLAAMGVLFLLGGSALVLTPAGRRKQN